MIGMRDGRAAVIFGPSSHADFPPSWSYCASPRRVASTMPGSRLIGEALTKGTTIQDFAKNLTPVLQAKGWRGKQGGCRSAHRRDR